MCRNSIMLLIVLLNMAIVQSFICSRYGLRRTRSHLRSTIITLSSSSTVLQGLRAENKSAFLDFEGIDQIALIPGTSESNTRNYFKPKALDGLSPPQMWDWWQQRRQSESTLKSAIANGKVEVAPYFEAHKQYLAADKAEVLQAHADFFRSVAEGDLGLMRALWLDSEESVCLQAGRSGWVVNGYKNIVAAWSLVLATAQPNMHTKDVMMFFQGDTAVVTCIVENTLPAPRNSKSSRRGRDKSRDRVVNSYHSTMIFTKPHTTDRYLLSAFIASTTPAADGAKRIKILKTAYKDPFRSSKNRRGGGGLGQGGVISLQQLLGGGGAISLGEASADNDDDDDDDDDDYDEVEISLSSDDIDDDDQDGEEGEDDLSPVSLEQDEDNDDDDDDMGDEKTPKQRAQRMKMDLQQAVARAMGNRIGKQQQMIVISSGGGSMSGGGGKGGLQEMLSKLGASTGKGDSNDDDDNDDDEEEEEDESIDKELAARTLLAVRWLHEKGALSTDEKRLITSDVIKNAGGSRFSRAEVAYSLLIGEGVSSNTDQQDSDSSQRRGSSWFSSSSSLSDSDSDDDNNRNPMDMNLVDQDDMREFEDMCHRIASDLSSKEKNSSAGSRRMKKTISSSGKKDITDTPDSKKKKTKKYVDEEEEEEEDSRPSRR